MKAALNFEDGPNGTVSVVLHLEGPANVSSKAHCLAMKMLEDMEQHAERLEDPKVTVDPLTEVQEGLDRSPLVIARGF